jgi:hypothetical protein
MSETELLGSWSPQNYIDERLDQYVEWYDGKAVKMKKRYLNMRAITVIGGAIVPVLLNIKLPYLNYFTTIISLLVVILVSLESVYHYREQWKNYRSTEQIINREKVYFLTKEGLYKNLDKEKAFILLVEQVESTIEAENTSTLNILTLASHSRESKKKDEEIN